MSKLMTIDELNALIVESHETGREIQCRSVNAEEFEKWGRTSLLEHEGGYYDTTVLNYRLKPECTYFKIYYTELEGFTVEHRGNPNEFNLRKSPTKIHEFELEGFDADHFVKTGVLKNE